MSRYAISNTPVQKLQFVTRCFNFVHSRLTNEWPQQPSVATSTAIITAINSTATTTRADPGNGKCSVSPPSYINIISMFLSLCRCISNYFFKIFSGTIPPPKPSTGAPCLRRSHVCPCDPLTIKSCVRLWTAERVKCKSCRNLPASDACRRLLRAYLPISDAFNNAATWAVPGDACIATTWPGEGGF